MCGQVPVDFPEMIKPRGKFVEFGSRLCLCDTALQLGNAAGDHGAVYILDGFGDLGQHCQTFIRNFGKSTQHNNLLLTAAGVHGQNPGSYRRYRRGMVGEHAKVTLDAGNIHLFDFT